ncbi:MAG: HAD family hydrolase [Nitriliruptoraceae bacterium]
MEATAVVFDLDGVLVDSERAWLEVERQAVRELGGVWEPRQDDELAGSAPTVANEALAARCGLQGREDELGAVILRRAPDVFAHQVLPIPGALETVRAVADLVPVAIATNACRVIAEVSMATTGLDRLVPTVVSVSDVRVGKPAPDVYLAAAAGIGIDPATCLAVDDTRTGLLAAVAAGMRTIAFGHPTRIPDGVMGGVPNWAETRIGRAG